MKGATSCPDGDTIVTSQECEVACQTLGKAIGNDLKDSEECYVAGNQKCRQDGRVGAKASMVCRGSDFVHKSKLKSNISIFFSCYTLENTF